MVEFVQIMVGGIVVGSIYALIALGFSLVYRVTGVINLAQGGFCTLGALTGYSLGVWLGLPALAAGVLAIVGTTLVFTMLFAVSFLSRLSRLSNTNMLMLTAGLLTLIEGLALVVWGSQPYALPPFSGD